MRFTKTRNLLTEVFRIANEFFKEAARRSVEAGCVGMWVSEDLGDSNRGFFNIDQYHRYVLPPFVELVEYVAGLGVPVLLHSCGCITAYLDDLAQTKISSIHPLQRTAKMDLGAVKKKYGNRFCLIGNIDSSRTLPYGTPADVATEARMAMDTAAPGGGYILASDHSLHDGIPVENIQNYSAWVRNTAATSTASVDSVTQTPFQKARDNCPQMAMAYLQSGLMFSSLPPDRASLVRPVFATTAGSCFQYSRLNTSSVSGPA